MPKYIAQCHNLLMISFFDHTVNTNINKKPSCR